MSERLTTTHVGVSRLSRQDDIRSVTLYLTVLVGTGVGAPVTGTSSSPGIPLVVGEEVVSTAGVGASVMGTSSSPG